MKLKYKISIVIFFSFLFLLLAQFLLLNTFFSEISVQDSLMLNFEKKRNAYFLIWSIFLIFVFLVLVYVANMVFIKQLSLFEESEMKTDQNTVSLQEYEDLKNMKKELETKLQQKNLEISKAKIKMEEEMNLKNKDLLNRIEVLESFKEVAEGREIKMIELKNHIGKLQSEITNLSKNK